MPRSPAAPRALLRFAVCWLLAAAPAAAAEPAARVETWRGGMAGAVSLTFDDALRSQLATLAPLLDKYGLRATFYLPTADVRDWHDWAALAEAGHEIGSHTVHHLDLTSLPDPQAFLELWLSQVQIQRAVGGGHGATLAYPFTKFDGGVQDLAKAFYLGARTGTSGSHGGPPPEPLPPTPQDLFALTAEQWTSQTKAATMNAWADAAIQTGGWSIEAAHGTDGDGFEPPPSREFEAHFAHLRSRAGELWVAPLGEVLRYIAERDAARVTERPMGLDAKRIVLDLAAPLPPQPVPLTLTAYVPGSWKRVRAEGGDILSIERTRAGLRIRLDVLPTQRAGGTTVLLTGLP